MKYTAMMSRFGLLLLLLGVAGCGSAQQGQVSGRVLLDGTPVPGGRVTFRPADGRHNSVSAELDRDGNYQAVLPAGEVDVSVDNRELEPVPSLGGGLPAGLPPEVRKALGGAKAEKPPPTSPENIPERPSGRYVKIPERYYQSETSELRFTVKGGDQKHDIELTK